MVRNIFVVVGVMLFLCSCASVNTTGELAEVISENNSFEEMIADNSESDDFLAGEKLDEPEWLEGVNRFTFGLNDSLYEYGLNPLSEGYESLMPDVLQKGISNFSHNILGAPERFLAALGQAKFKFAGMELGKTIINIVTFGGIFPSVDIGEIPDDEDFGQMFGSWGVSEGYFVVLPLMGPATVRDAAGTVLASQLNPVSFVGDFETVPTVGGVDMINGYEEEIAPYNALKENSMDEYSAIKNAYLQSRRSKIKK